MESIKDNYVKKKKKWKNPQIYNRKEQIMGEKIILIDLTARILKMMNMNLHEEEALQSSNRIYKK